MVIGAQRPWKGERIPIATAALVLAILTVALLWPGLDGTVLSAADGDQYERLAFNLVRHGEFHDSPKVPKILAEGGDLRAYSRREPGYALYLASVFVTFPQLRSLSMAPPPWCPRTKKRIRDIPGYAGICRDIVGWAPGVSAQ